MSPRLRAFAVVGAIGFVVQLAVLAALQHAGAALPVATALAVEAAVLHNFVWHERWTWRDRTRVAGWRSRLLRFHSSNALVSLVVNVGLTSAFAGLMHVPPLLANAMAVAVASLANFLAADRWVFARGPAIAVLASLLTASAASAAGPPPEALVAWTRHVQEVESSGTGRQTDCHPGDEPVGGSTKVAGGTIFRWSSCTIAKGVTVPLLIDALIASGTPPPQEDVLESRLLARDGDRLRVYLKVIRRTIMTVSYHTEHDMVFRRTSDRLATSRSSATSIAQTDGGDHGFLWRLNSYWVYRQVGADVRIELVSLSLSRDVPLVVRPVAGPLIRRVARESMERTLDAIRQFGENAGRHPRAVRVRPVDGH